jgi:hypothetical protein
VSTRHQDLHQSVSVSKYVTMLTYQRGKFSIRIPVSSAGKYVTEAFEWSYTITSSIRPADVVETHACVPYHTLRRLPDLLRV